MSTHYAKGFTDQGTCTPDNLFAGEFPAIKRLETITGGAALTRGAVLGCITASGLYCLSVASASDGSQKPVAILAEDVNAAANDVQAVVYLSGEFNSNALTYGEGHTAASVCKSLRTDGPSTLVLHKNQEA